MNRQEYLELIKSLAYSSIKESLMAAIIKRLPIFAGSILNPILGYVVGKVLTIAFEETELRIFFLYTDFRIGQQGKDFKLAIDAFKEGKIDEKEFINTFRTLVKFNS